jgi:hypothetical protein
MSNDYPATGDDWRQPISPYTTNEDPASRSPLTGHDPNFLDNLLPIYDPTSPRGSPDRAEYQAFYEAYRAGPSPPPPNFLDTILNPAGLNHNRYTPFDYQPSPAAYRPTTDDMPPTTRGNPQGISRPARLPNGYVDLTSTPDSPPQRRKRESTSPGPAKRQKRDDGTANKPEGSKNMRVEEVDLTEDRKPMQDVLQKQREDAIKAQAKPEETKTTFNSFTCVICMDMPTDLTATACGTCA